MRKHRSLSQQVADNLILHTRFEETLRIVCDRIDQGIAVSEPKLTWIIGASRVGKSALINEIMRRYPKATEGGRVRITVLRVKTPGATSPHLLPISVLKALKVHRSFSNKSTGELTAAALEQLELAGTKAILYEEASQMVELGAKVTPYDVSEWLKDLHNQANVSQVLLGVQRLQRLIDVNPQLRGRSYKVIRWLPYDATQQTEWEDYVATLRQLLAPILGHGWFLTATESVVAANFYLHAPGLVGGLCDAIKVLATQLDGKEPGALTFDMLRQACDALEPLGHPQHPAFVKKDLGLYDLREAYRHVLKINDMD